MALPGIMRRFGAGRRSIGGWDGWWDGEEDDDDHVDDVDGLA